MLEEMQAHLVGVQLLVGKYSLLITHLYQVICCLYTFTTLNVQSLFSMKGIYGLRGVKASAQKSRRCCNLSKNVVSVRTGDVRHDCKNQ